jgi:enolase
MTDIAAVRARQVWDSRGRPTVEVDVRLRSGAWGRAVAPSGASTGSREALDLRDGGERLGGFGVNRALSAVNGEIATRLAGMDADQIAVDRALIDLDGTPQKQRLGGNACVATSCALAWAVAAEKGVPLWRQLRHLAALPDTPHAPIPMIQIFGGGAHAGNRVDVQDFLVLPLNAPSFAEAVEWTAEIYRAAAGIMKSRGALFGVSDEGGLWPAFSTNEEVLATLTEAIASAGFNGSGRDVGIALDIAATNFFDDGAYALRLEGRRLSTAQMIEMLTAWCDRYPVVSLEDPLAEDDDDGLVAITAALGERCQIVGDDYLTTDAARIRRAAALGACNAALLKANQCGTITELIAAASAARAAGWNAVMSGRSGESEDVTLSHLAVGLLSHQIKVGSVTRSERTAKWNEVIRIEEGLPGGACRPFTLPSRPR